MNEHAQHNGHASEHNSHADPHAGHGGMEDHATMFRRRFWITLALTIPVIASSEMVQEWLGFDPPLFTGQELVGPILGTVIFFYGGWPFLTGALSEIRSKQPGMMLLIGMAIAVAFGASAATTFELLDLEFWWELSALIAIMLLGHWLEMRAVGQAQGALAAFAELLPDDAERVTPEGVEVVSIGEL